MNFRLKIGRFAGVDVFLHWTFLFSPIYVAFDGWRNGFNLAQIGFMIMLLLAVFVCIVMHEFGHSLAARLFGVKTKDIMITPIGGLARLTKMPRRPFEELIITIAGPLVNLLIAIVLSLFIWLNNDSFFPTRRYFPNFRDFPMLLTWINLFLFAFNLLPAFPMDGGRILRSSIAFFAGFEKATLIAGRLGQILASIFMVFGISVLLFQGILPEAMLGWANPLAAPLAIIGAFVFFAANSEMGYSRYLMKEASQKDFQ